MAKWGEGDPRWIVEDRPDATNVNNWHWAEKNATPWSKDRLKSLLTNLVVNEGGIECVITAVEKCEGEATANNRKSKLIFFYEWNIVCKWEGRMPQQEKAGATGKITIPNLSEENDLDDITIMISLDESNATADQLKDFMYNVGRDKVRTQLDTYIKELKEEYSKGLILPRKDEKPIKADSVAKHATGFNTTKPQTVSDNGNQASGEGQAQQQTIGCKLQVSTLTTSERFQCRANDLYEVLTKKEMVQAFTRGDVKLEASRGGEFVLFGGNITGKFEELVPGKKIRQSWRYKLWPSGHLSTVTMELTEHDDHTELQLTQVGVPTSEMNTTRNNWTQYYWNSIKQTFGYGSFLF